jgi:NTP pyrophosphatase (non-canonical NTP hydrolase)
MNTQDYIQNAIKTESGDYADILSRFSTRNVRLLHAAIGLSTESGEVLDMLKKHLYYGKTLDEVNLKEEMGDLFWYLAIMADALGVDFETVMKTNIDKLKARYGSKFTDEKAINRDLNLERQILEGKV